MKLTYEEYAKNHKYPCIALTEVARQAKERNTTIEYLVDYYTSQFVTVVKWA